MMLCVSLGGRGLRMQKAERALGSVHLPQELSHSGRFIRTAGYLLLRIYSPVRVFVWDPNPAGPTSPALELKSSVPRITSIPASHTINHILFPSIN